MDMAPAIRKKVPSINKYTEQNTESPDIAFSFDILYKIFVIDGYFMYLILINFQSSFLKEIFQPYSQV